MNLLIWGKNHSMPECIGQNVRTAAAGQNHIVFVNKSGQAYGMGSNKFGQLGLNDPQFQSKPVPVFAGHSIKSLHCGPEHTFFITDSNEVYSCGLNIKGQLGHSLFDNSKAPKIVPVLLPNGPKNQRSLNPALNKPPKNPIVDMLQKFDLQVKIDDPNDRPFQLSADEYVVDISCGALFTLALTNLGRVLSCGLIGSSPTTLDEQVERTRFREVKAWQGKVASMGAGLSGAGVVLQDGTCYVWGRFGRLSIAAPKRLVRERGLLGQVQEAMVGVWVGDEFVLALTERGQALVMGENIHNQLGVQSHKEPFRDSLGELAKEMLTERVFIGRNGGYLVGVQDGQLWAWGSNRYGQLFPVEGKHGVGTILPHAMPSGQTISEDQQVITSSYFTLLLTPHKHISFSSLQQQPSSENEETIAYSEYKKLLADYQLIKALNLTLLQKQQPTRKEVKQTQTPSKFEISGVTQHRKFNSNTEIKWKQLALETQISEGGYGMIWKARWREVTVVVKKFKIDRGDANLKDFLSQCHAMEAVRHPSIVMFLGAVTTHPNYSIVLEYCARGSLWSYVQNKDNPLPWEERRRFAIEIAQGVHYLHCCTPPILHRDLKSLNIFLDANLRIKIGDFGWTKALEEYMTNKIGTYQWMAPEVIGSRPYTQKADVFSYAIILWEIASREPPYRNIKGDRVSEEVLHKGLRPPMPQKCPEAWGKLMKRCWETNPADRPTFRQVIKELQTIKLQ